MVSMKICLTDQEGQELNTSWKYCRGHLFKEMRNILWQMYEFRGNIEVKHYLFKCNYTVTRTLPEVQEAVRHIAPIQAVTDCAFDRDAVFHLRPEFLNYGWAINTLLIGHLRCFIHAGADNTAHWYDIEDLDKRLELWWENTWVDDPIVTWFLDLVRISKYRAALGSVFTGCNCERTCICGNSFGGYCGSENTYLTSWLPDHPIATFSKRMLDRGLTRRGRNPS